MDSAPTQKTSNIESVPLTYSGTTFHFTFNWGVFETLNAVWGEEYQTKIADLMTGRDLTNLRYVASLTSGAEFGPDTFLPVQRVINTLYRAHELGWAGRDVGPVPEEDSETAGKKPQPYPKPSTSIWTLGYLWGLRGRIFSRERRTPRPAP